MARSVAADVSEEGRPESVTELESSPGRSPRDSPPPESITSIKRQDSKLSFSPLTTREYPPSTFERPVPLLPPTDRGRQAYLFLTSAFIVETVIWGLPSSYGVFLQYYQLEGVHGGNETGASLLPLVGSFASGLMYLFGPPLALLLNPRPRYRVPAIRVGACICVLALILSSFAKTAWHLLLTQGLLYSIGGSMVYYPSFSFLSEWFIVRRGFANGVCFAGTAAGGLVYPFLLDFLLQKYGSGVTLQALAVLTAVLLASAMPRLQPRIPVTSTSAPSRREHPATRPKTWWKSKRLWAFQIANVMQAFGFFLPTLYLPIFASSLGLSTAVGSGLLAAVNATSVISRLAVGVLSDRMSPHIIGAVTLAASSLTVIILWGVTSTSLAPLMIFSLILGLSAGGWTSLYSSIVRDAAKDDPQLVATLFGLVSFTRGIGSLLTAPISSFLVTQPLSKALPSTGFGISGGQYGSLVVFAGVSLAIAAGMETVASI